MHMKLSPKTTDDGRRFRFVRHSRKTPLDSSIERRVIKNPYMYIYIRNARSAVVYENAPPFYAGDPARFELATYNNKRMGQ